MALAQHDLQLADRLRVSEPLTGDRVVQPAQLEAVLGCSEATSKDVVEGVEVMAPIPAGNHDATDFFVEALERRKALAVDLVDLGHPDQARVASVIRYSRPQRTLPSAGVT